MCTFYLINMSKAGLRARWFFLTLYSKLLSRGATAQLEWLPAVLWEDRGGKDSSVCQEEQGSNQTDPPRESTQPKEKFRQPGGADRTGTQRGEEGSLHRQNASSNTASGAGRKPQVHEEQGCVQHGLLPLHEETGQQEYGEITVGAAKWLLQLAVWGAN